MLKATIQDDDIKEIAKKIPLFFETFGVIIAEEMRKVMAVYPNFIPDKSPGKTYYARGSGTVYVKKSGGTTRYGNSEMLGRRWEVIPSKGNVILRNKASYSAYVHHSDYQNRLHYKRGWANEEDALRSIDFSEVYDIVAKTLNIN